MSAATKMNKRTVTAKDVMLYIPNKIGYLRVLTMVISLFFMPRYPTVTTLVYGLSCLLDALDGTMARKYDQCSQLGAVLDMVSDRSTTACLLCYLCVAYSQNFYIVIFLQLMNSLDLSSHYIHMYATLSCSNKKSHKTIESNENWLLYMYYSNRKVLFTICALNELFYMSLYWLSFTDSLMWSKIGFWFFVVTLPGYVFKQVANVIQLNRAVVMLAESDASIANEKKN
jgi:CDP-diacylglycerol--inositol 3-phosphatidyltransferase